MRRLPAIALALALLSLGCGGSEDNQTLPVVSANDAFTSCPADDPNCGDDTDAGPLPDAVSVGDPNDPDAPLAISFGGFFYSDGTTSQLCSALAESFPPQCGSVVIDIEAPIDVVLEHVAESWGDPADAKINIDGGVYWTDDWVNLSGVLENNRLVLE